MATDTGFSIIVDVFWSIEFTWCSNNSSSNFPTQKSPSRYDGGVPIICDWAWGTNSPSIFKIESERISHPMRIRSSLSYREVWSMVWIICRAFPIASLTFNNTSVIIGAPFISPNSFVTLLVLVALIFRICLEASLLGGPGCRDLWPVNRLL
jgi:hypothetical protein